MKFKREYLKELTDRISAPRKFIQALTGPRQIGKTTLVKQFTQNTNIPFLYVSADESPGMTNVWIEQMWETARIKLKNTKGKEFILIIDEIQKIRQWSDTVKLLWDADTFNNVNLKVVLLGSSGLMLQEGLHESLAGRYELIEMQHWSFTEMNQCFGISEEEYAWFGGYPGSVSFMNEEERWKDYIRNSLIEATISKDVLMLTRIDKPALMRQVFELGVIYSSKILSFSKMLGQLQDAGNTTTISHYLKLLDVAGLLTGIQKIYVEKYRERSSSPKWQVKNTALYSALLPITFEQVQMDPVRWGQVIESAIGAHLVNMAKAGKYEVLYWRHKNEEVDFVLRKDESVIGIEVKSWFTKPTKGMAAFKEKFDPDKVLLVGTSGLHWKEFLRMDPADLF